jgi:thiamine biosynthesis protein ThiS
MINLTINGKERQIEADTNLVQYLESLGLMNLKAIAVAHNGNVLRRDEYASVTLKSGDKVEIVRAVGGGL